MRIKNFTGFILGNAYHQYPLGTQWVRHDERLWGCQNLETAKRVLHESHQHLAVEHKPVWTTIYQVSGQNIVFEKGNNGILYTNTPTDLVVNRRVYHKMPANIHEEDLLRNADAIAHGLSKLWGNEK